MKKLFLSLMAAVMLMTGFCATALAAEPEVPETGVTASSEEGIQPYSDIIELKLRTDAAGRLQYRHWNATRGRWVEPEWMYFNEP